MQAIAPAPFKEIAGEKLTDEQTAYLDGLFAGLRNRGVSFGDVVPNPVSSPASGSNTEDLIFEERVKRELHPLDAYQQIIDNAAGDIAPDKESVFRFKWNGLFWLSPVHEGYMCRLRIPGGLVRTFQLRELAGISTELTSGYVQITTRANFQLRLIKPKNAPEVLQRIQNVGLHSRGAGADNLRNITANPTSGVDPFELINVMPLCQQLANHLINHREFYDLPRKFNIAYDGGGLIGTVEDTNDIGLRAVKLETAHGEAGPGVYFRVSLGGATGHQAFARDAGVLVRPDEVNKVVLALVRVFIRHGNRGNRKRARLKHLLEKWTIEQYLEETEKLLGRTLLRAGPDLGKPAGSPTTPHSHVGVFPQRQEGLSYVGVAIPVGQISPKQMVQLADVADRYGSGEVRLTVWQNLIIPNIANEDVSAVVKAVRKAGFSTEQSHLRDGFIACTGNSYCKFASSNTKGHALELMGYLDKKLKLDAPVNVHLTGCPHSCAQHYMGDIGLLGAKVKVQGETVEGYHVFIGGGFGSNQALGRQIFQGLAFPEVKTTLEKMLKGYLRHRNGDESFQAWANRHDLNRLQAIFTNDE